MHCLRDIQHLHPQKLTWNPAKWEVQKIFASFFGQLFKSFQPLISIFFGGEQHTPFASTKSALFWDYRSIWLIRIILV